MPRGSSGPFAVAALLAACAAEPPMSAKTEQSMSVCASGPTIFGIDVSRFQGAIDWQQVQGAGVVYAWIQISRSLTDIDARFPYNWRRAKEVGILRGAYQRFHPGEDVAGQANLFLDKLGPFQSGDLPPMLDVEDADGLPAATIAQRVKQWMDIVEPAVGRKPLIYTGYYFWRDSVGGADFHEHPLWIANYSAVCPLVPPAWTRWHFHQYSSTVRLPGITENTVDVNKFDGTLDELKSLGQPPACGDGRCNGAETPDSCPTECTPCQTIAGDDRIVGGDIVDDASACFHTGGNPMYIREEAAGHDGTLKWTHATDLATPANYGVWNLHFAKAGRYRVEAFTPAPFNQSKRAVYEVVHAGMTTTKLAVDQSAVDGWNLLGELDFDAGSHNQSVRLNDNTGEPNSAHVQLVFDALRFTRLADGGGATPADDDTGDGDEAGCSTSHGTSWLALLLLLLLRNGVRPTLQKL